MFEWLVARINSGLFTKSASCTINILDIFGFEDFAHNTFEQVLALSRNVVAFVLDFVTPSLAALHQLRQREAALSVCRRSAENRAGCS
jgi:hypothetical protein